MQHAPGGRRLQNLTVSAFPSEPVAPDHPNRYQTGGRGPRHRVRSSQACGIAHNFISRRDPEPCRQRDGTRPVITPQAPFWLNLISPGLAIGGWKYNWQLARGRGLDSYRDWTGGQTLLRLQDLITFMQTKYFFGVCLPHPKSKPVELN
jgi:hypothetical protein